MKYTLCLFLVVVLVSQQVLAKAPLVKAIDNAAHGVADSAVDAADSIANAAVDGADDIASAGKDVAHDAKHEAHKIF